TRECEAMAEREMDNQPDAVGSVYWRDEVLQVMYWMAGEGFGQEFTLADLRKFLSAGADVLEENLDQMVTTGLLERVSGEKYTLTAQGKKEGGRRFADEFEEMLKPGHFECDEPDCDCHDPDSIEGACKHFFAAQEPQ
ncbi:MAG: hypothetical protein M3R69_12725, partial [Acidobacteriota bacterium]|nr:hypothetical protein [Acidobacteriota bacterium]